MYMSRAAESAVAERIQQFRGRRLTDAHLATRDGRPFALAAFDDSTLDPVIDLDDPSQLVNRELRPSAVATSVRSTTQGFALSIFAEGVLGFGWWSILEGSW